MPERNLIQNKVGTDFLSVQLYDPALSFNDFSPQTEFAKCAMVEVSEFKNIPRGMETLTLVGGLYAVFYTKEEYKISQKPWNMFSDNGYQIRIMKCCGHNTNRIVGILKKRFLFRSGSVITTLCKTTITTPQPQHPQSVRLG